MRILYFATFDNIPIQPFPDRINSGGATYLAEETHMTNLMGKFVSEHFNHILLYPFYKTNLREFFFWINPVSYILHSLYSLISLQIV